MSAVRNTGNNRNHGILPYTRPQAKKSGWSLSGFLSTINPFKYVASEQQDYAMENGEDLEEENLIAPKSPADYLSKRGHEISRQLNGNGAAASANGSGLFSTPTKPSRTTNLFTFPTSASQTDLDDISPPRPSASPARNIAAAKEYLAGKAGQPLNEAEVEGLRELLENSEPIAEENVPFRFSSTAPLTPDRGRSPVQATRKTLQRNPNGTYRWGGAGSARRPVSRNRYSSPAFGPSRSRSERVILRETQSEGDALKTDNKRRRVGDETTSSVGSSSGSTPKENGAPAPPPRSSAPEPSPTRAQQAAPFPAESPSKLPAAKAKSPAPNTPSRLRIPQKPTAPVHPSPLRQAWSGGSPGSQNGDSPTKTPPTLQKQTKTANFMTELIKEVTPTKRPDLSNPYQTASPVKPTTHSKPRVTRRTRATGKPTVPDVSKAKKEEPEKTISPQAIIEATLPKGSKRSRPPTNLENSTSGKPNGAARQAPSAPYVVEEEDEEADIEISPKKKSKPSPEPFAQKPSPSEIVIEEVEDVDPMVAVEKPKSVTSPPPSNGSLFSQPATKSAFPAFKSTFAPKEPSKLRTSYQPDSAASSPAPPAQPLLPPAVNVPGTSLFGAKQDASTSASMEVDPKEAALKAPVTSLPTYAFTFTAILSSGSEVSNKVKSMAPPSLPSFAFAAPIPKLAGSQPAPIKAFDFAAAGVKTAGNGGDWTCSLCMLQNPASATEQCKVCEAPKPGATSTSSSTKSTPASTPAPSTGFNWAAAGAKPPTNGAAGSEWTCSTCMLKNPATATEKCAICEEPKPGAAPKPTAALGFNWAAAGIKQPSAGTAEWTCSSCMLKNPASATAKCTICEADR